jgi:hypothetical protein
MPMRLSLKPTRAAVYAAMALTGLGAQAGFADPSPARVFSSLCTQAEGGDISGYRIKILGAEPSLTVSFEETEGALMAASETKDVSFSATTGELAFKVATEAGPIAFRGHIAATALDGTLTRAGDTPEAIHLASDAGGDGESACPATPDSAKP